MDLTARNLQLLTTNHWMKDPRNVVVVTLTQPSWRQPLQAALVVAPPAEKLGAWTVAEVAHFYEGADAAGLAVTLQKNAVNGADMAGFSSWEQLAEDIRMTPFAARKVLRLRDYPSGAFGSRC